MKLHVVDGTFELFRAFYGPPSRTNDDGMEIGAARGLFRSLVSLLEEDDVTHVGVAFDTVIESFRNDLFLGYKTGAGIDPDLWAQFPLAEQVSEALGLVTWRMRKFEADDALAAAAVRFADDVEQVVICSPDKDLSQVVRGNQIITRDRIRSTERDEDAVREKFGVGPAQIPDYLGLIGDKADGIPGIPRWGAKSTATVLNRYGSVEKIPLDPDAWDIKVRGSKTLAKNLAAQREDALLYKTLATLRLDVPLEQSTLEDMRWRGADREKVDELVKVIGRSSAIDRIPAWQ